MPGMIFPTLEVVGFKSTASFLHPFCTLSFAKLTPYKRKLGVKWLIFVTADSCRPQLERLTRILVSAFPGSTVYQHKELLRVSHDVLRHRVDAVLLAAETDGADGLDFMRLLRRQKPDIPVFIIAKTEGFREQAEAAGANGCFVLPDGEQQLLDAIRLTQKRDNVS